MGPAAVILVLIHQEMSPPMQRLDFETAKSYALTLTATAGSTSVTDTFTVNVGNMWKSLIQLFCDTQQTYNSASRSGFNATATRGPSGSSLPAYYLEQIGTTASTSVITSVVDNVSNNSCASRNCNGGSANLTGVIFSLSIPQDANGHVCICPEQCLYG